jgi:protein YIPF6
LLISGVEEQRTLQWQLYLPTSITMASSSNPYEHYNSPQVEDEDDLIDPDDGMCHTFLFLEMQILD